MDSLVVPSRPGHRLVSAVLGTVLASAAALGAAQIVAAPAALLNHAEGGGVAVAPKGDNEWTDVKARRALKRGDRVWTDKGARAEVQAGIHALRLDSQTQVALDSVGDGGTQLSLVRGSMAASVPKLSAGENFEVGTPNLALRAKLPGEYRVDVDPQQGTTRVSVMSGAAVVYGEHGETVDVAAGQRLTFRDRSLAKAPTPAFTVVDEFDRWIVARGRAAAQQPAASSQPSVHPDVIAKMHREQESQRQATMVRQLEEQKLALARQQAQAQRQPAPAAAAAMVAPPPVAAKPAVVAPPPVAAKPAAAAPAVVQVPRPRADEARVAAARKADEDQRSARAAQARRAEAERQAALARKAEEERRVAQARRTQDDRKVAATRRAEDERRQLAAKRSQEQQRLAQAKKAEEERRAAIARKAEQDRKLAQARKQQQLLQAQGDARRGEYLARLQEQARREEQAAREQRSRREQALREEELRREEQARREAWELRQRALADQQRRDHEVWLRTQQPVPMVPVRPMPQGVPARRIS